jgi:hypothetical protein
MAMEMLLRLTRGIGFNKFASVVSEKLALQNSNVDYGFLTNSRSNLISGNFKDGGSIKRYITKELNCPIFRGLLEYGRR